MHACYILKIVQNIIFFLNRNIKISFKNRILWYLSNHFWKFRSNVCASTTVLLYCRCQVNVCAYCLNREKQNTT